MISTKLNVFCRGIIVCGIVALGLFKPEDARASQRDDIVLKFSDVAIVVVTVNGTAFDASISGGAAALMATDRDCVPTLTVPCTYTINSFQLNSEGFEFDDEGDVGTISDLILGVDGAQPAVDDGSGIGVAPQFPAFMALDLNFLGESGRRLAQQPGPSGIKINLNEATRTATYTAAFSGIVGGATVEFFMNGSGEVVNLPPHANGTANVGSTCSGGAVTTLDATTSTDPENNISIARWFDGEFLIAQGLNVTTQLGGGVHNLRLAVSDEFGGEDSQSIVVDVAPNDTTPPVFTFVPPDVNNQDCSSAINLGQATATDDCALASLDNDAPAQFPLGMTVVTWTATDSSGNFTTATQRVTVVDTHRPVFTFVPPSITVSNCVGPNIGQATATDDCSPVTITNNAPAKFPLGTTVVTWKATDSTGNFSTATQTVIAILGDDTSCCPNGTHIMVGTSASNTFSGTPGADCILGRGGDDVINSGDGNDFVSGGAGRDTITTGNGNDYLNGGTEFDTCFAPPGSDTVLSCP